MFRRAAGVANHPIVFIAMAFGAMLRSGARSRRSGCCAGRRGVARVGADAEPAVPAAFACKRAGHSPAVSCTSCNQMGCFAAAAGRRRIDPSQKSSIAAPCADPLYANTMARGEYLASWRVHPRLFRDLLTLGDWRGQAQQCDTLLKGGHVIDPKNGGDRVIEVAVRRLNRGNFEFLDSAGARKSGKRSLVCESALRAGKMGWELNGRASQDWKTFPYQKAIMEKTNHFFCQYSFCSARACLFAQPQPYDLLLRRRTCDRREKQHRRRARRRHSRRQDRRRWPQRIDPAQAFEGGERRGPLCDARADRHPRARLRGHGRSRVPTRATTAYIPTDTRSAWACTTVADAGCAGWRNFEDFKQRVIDRSKTRVLAFINIVGNGMRGAEVRERPGRHASQADRRDGDEVQGH